MCRRWSSRGYLIDFIVCSFLSHHLNFSSTELIKRADRKVPLGVGGLAVQYHYIPSQARVDENVTSRGQTLSKSALKHITPTRSSYFGSLLLLQSKSIFVEITPRPQGRQAPSTCALCAITIISKVLTTSSCTATPGETVLSSSNLTQVLDMRASDVNNQRCSGVIAFANAWLFQACSDYPGRSN